MAHEAIAALPTPPRLTGDYATDAKILSDWIYGFYRVGVLETGLLDPTFQANAGEAIDPDSLPDPTHTTIARAQATANLAYEKGEEAEEKADNALARVALLVTEFTLSGSNNQAVVTFSAELPSINYAVHIDAQDFSGTPGVEAFILVRATKTVSSVTLLFGAAPGSGNSITFAISVVPKT